MNTQFSPEATFVNETLNLPVSLEVRRQYWEIHYYSGYCLKGKATLVW